MPSPLVSVIIPLHNAAPYIAECIESVLGQTYQDVEVIVVENCSTDNSLSVAKRYECEKVRVLISDIPNASAARNMGLREAKGEYIQFLDADDILPAEKITSQILLLAQYSSRAVCFCPWYMIQGRSNRISQNVCHSYNNAVDALVELSLNESCILLHCYLTPISIIRDSGLWNETLTLSDDGDFFARVLANADELLFCNEVSVPYRDAPNSLSKSISKTAIDSQIRSAISIADSMKKSKHPQTKIAQVSNLVRSVNYLYPYFRQERKKIESIIRRDYGIYDMQYPKRTWKEYAYYFCVRLGLFKSYYQL